jgi:UPF0755 protein
MKDFIPMKTWTKYLAIGTLSIAFIAGAMIGIIWRDMSSHGQHRHMPQDKDRIEVIIKRGMGPKAISNLLQKKGVVAKGDDFYKYLRFIAKKTASLKSGEYELTASMSMDEIIAALEKGRIKETRFTINEGLRKTEIAKIISDAGICSESELLTAMEDPSLIDAFGVPKKGAGGQNQIQGGMEGYLYPDTYQFAKGTPAKKILTRLRNRLDEVIDDKMKKRMKEMGWNLHKVLTLAAIVEKETGQPDERPHIASVFHNRIKLKMKMQTDPTVIYGIPNYNGNIRKKDLLTPRPYNTYTIAGLPPGPIASPGKDAITAVLWPDDKDDLFFVSRNDGTHIFCPTLKCHNAAVKKWQIEYFRKKR